MAVKLHYKKLKDGSKSAWLDIHYKGIRLRPSIGIILEKEDSTEARKRNRERKSLAEQIKIKKELELLNDQWGITQYSQKKYANFYDLIDYEVSISQRKDKRGFNTVTNKLKEFSKREILPISEISIEFVEKFKSFLEKTLTGESPYDYYKKFNYILKKAVKKGYLKSNPASDIKVKKGKAKIKDVLTPEEAKKLLATKCPNNEVKRAFIFCIYTGLRYCDVKDLEWGHVHESLLRIIQSKTNEYVEVPLKKEIVSFLGNRGSFDAKVFCLPSHNACLKSLKAWTRNAAINKHITWHCARHSFGTLLVENGVDILITSKLLGHKSLTHTLRYVRIVENQKTQAINKIPSIF